MFWLGGTTFVTQETAISILKTGANVFLTGEPGSGKTYTVNLYIKYLRTHGIKPAVTASTGIAATHLGGMTIHSWSGIGIKKELTDQDIKRLSTNRRLLKRAQKTSVLIIDEVSMLESRVLSSVDQAIQVLRKNNKPFGGMQVVLVGDFFQLPPVSKKGESPANFAFKSPSWAQADFAICYLSEQHRQKDSPFLALLNSVRSAKNTSEAHSTLAARKIKISSQETITRLYSHNADVDRLNDEKISALSEEEFSFEMESHGPKALVSQLKKGCLSPETLILKKGAYVMFTKNDFRKGFVNGTLGEVIMFTNDGIPVVLTKNGRQIEVLPMEWSISDGVKDLASISQIPLRLAWAITVHKSQGMTLDSAIVDLSHAFEYGQGYVAISRVRTLSGLFLLGYNKRALEVHPTISGVDDYFRHESRKSEGFLGRFSNLKLSSKHKGFISACGGSLKKVAPKIIINTYDTTLKLLQEDNGIRKIAKIRGLTQGTILKHVEKLFMRDRVSEKQIRALMSPSLEKAMPKIHEAFEKLGTERLSPVYEELREYYTYDDLRLTRLLM